MSLTNSALLAFFVPFFLHASYLIISRVVDWYNGTADWVSLVVSFVAGMIPLACAKGSESPKALLLAAYLMGVPVPLFYFTFLIIGIVFQRWL